MPRRTAITGAAGQLGRQLVGVFGEAGDEVLALSHPDFDVTRPADLARLSAWQPEVVINAAAWTDVDGCARDPERAMRVNGAGAGAVAEAAERAGASIVQISTNEVFDGALERAYKEEDRPNPINPYGASKLEGETRVAEARTRSLIVRTAWLFGPGRDNFVTKIIAAGQRARAAGQPLRVVADEWGNPTPTPELARAILDLVADRMTGIAHVAGQPPTSRHGWATWILEAAGVDGVCEPISSSEFARASRPPPRAILDSLRVAGTLEWKLATQALARDTVGAA